MKKLCIPLFFILCVLNSSASFGQNGRKFHSKPSNHYLSKKGERYYMDIVPPKMKGKEIDHSDVWLLGAK